MSKKRLTEVDRVIDIFFKTFDTFGYPDFKHWNDKADDHKKRNHVKDYLKFIIEKEFK